MRLNSRRSGDRRDRTWRDSSWNTTADHVSPGHVVSRDAGRRQRRPDQEGPGRDRLRLGLPRRHLRACAASSSTAIPHGPDRGTTVCQLHMRRFKDGDTITDRALARQGVPGRQGPGRRSQRVRSHHRARAATCRSTAAARPTATRSRFPKDVAELAMDVGRLHRLRRLRGGLQERVGPSLHEREDLASRARCRRAQVEAHAPRRARWSQQADAEGFGSCSNEGECEAVCPKEIPISNIARMTRDYVRAMLGTLGTPPTLTEDPRPATFRPASASPYTSQHPHPAGLRSRPDTCCPPAGCRYSPGSKASCRQSRAAC